MPITVKFPSAYNPALRKYTEHLRWRPGKASGNMSTVDAIDCTIEDNYVEKTVRPLLFTWRKTGLNLFILDFDRKDYLGKYGHSDEEIWEYARQLADHYDGILFSSCTNAPKVALLVSHELTWNGYDFERLLKEMFDETTLTLIDHKPAAFYSIFLGTAGASTLSQELVNHHQRKRIRKVYNFSEFKKEEEAPIQFTAPTPSKYRAHDDWAKHLIPDDVKWQELLKANPTVREAYYLQDIPQPTDWQRFLRFLCGKRNLFPTLMSEGNTPGVLPIRYIADNLGMHQFAVGVYIRKCLDLKFLDRLQDGNYAEGRAATYEGGPALEVICEAYGNKRRGLPYQEVEEGDTLKARRGLAFIAESEAQIREWAHTSHRWLLVKGRLDNCIKHFYLYRGRKPVAQQIEKHAADV